MSPMEMVQTVFSDPPLPLSEIIRAGTTRAKAQLPPVGGSPLRPLPEYPSRDGRKPYLLRDPAQADDTLWGSFQAQLRTRLLKRNEPPPPPPQPKTFTSSLAMPKVAPRSPSPSRRRWRTPWRPARRERRGGRPREAWMGRAMFLLFTFTPRMDSG